MKVLSESQWRNLVEFIVVNHWVDLGCDPRNASVEEINRAIGRVARPTPTGEAEPGLHEIYPETSPDAVAYVATNTDAPVGELSTLNKLQDGIGSSYLADWERFPFRDAEDHETFRRIRSRHGADQVVEPDQMHAALMTANSAAAAIEQVTSN